MPLLVRSTLLTVESCSALGLRSVSPRVALTLIVYLPSTAWAPREVSPSHAKLEMPASASPSSSLRTSRPLESLIVTVTLSAALASSKPP